jgi:c-di-GMP-binding flagellar brake protein YcgR
MIERKYKRVPVRVPLYVSLDGEVILQKMIRLESRDLSGGGLAFETSKKIPIEANSRVVVARLGDLSDSAQIEGRVVYLRKEPTGRYSIGLEFTRFINVTQEELLNRIAEWESEATHPPV